jgi:hypothetical protein
MKIRHLVAIPSVVLFLLLCHPPVYADSFTFSTLPGTGNVAGPAGSTVGWGYSLSNQSLTDWLVTTAISAGTFLYGTPSAIFDFPILAPGATISVPFSAVGGLGLYQLTWSATAPGGFVNSGTFDLSAEWWNGDPLAGGSFVTNAADQTAAYTATVTALPVPSTLLLMAVGLAAMCLKRQTVGPV